MSAPPFVPEPLLPGGLVKSLYPDGTAPLNARARAHESEVYNLGDYHLGDRIHTITNVHSPSFDLYKARSPAPKTGACAILVPGGGNRVLGVGGCVDLVSTLGAFGVSTAILRCRLRSDGYDMSKDALQDTLRCIQLVRENAEGWGLDTKRIGVVGFSAGATHSASAATEYPAFDARAAQQGRVRDAPAATSRPDFVGVLFPGPTLFETAESKALTELGFGRFAGMTAAGAESQAALEGQRDLEIASRNGPPTIPADVPPSFVASPGPGDKIHAAWALEFYSAMLFEGVPNIELILYAQGVHGQLPSGAGGVGAWHARFLEWLSALGFLAPSGEETLASKHVALFATGRPVPQVVGPGAMRAKM
jgi:acetyl esterase/lipase